MALEREIETYCREIKRLLAEGESGRFALIKGDEVINTFRDALQAGYEKYGLTEPFATKKLIHVIPSL